MRQPPGEPPPPTPPPPVRRKDRRDKKSAYPGVKREKPLADGTPRWGANVWDAQAGKNKWLGTFGSEFEAALAAAKARGDEEQVQRIVGQLEEAENNPNQPGEIEDRPNRRRVQHNYPGDCRPAKNESAPAAVLDGVPPPTPVVAWECNRCCARVDQAERPTRCVKCGRDCGFTEIK